MPKHPGKKRSAFRAAADKFFSDEESRSKKKKIVSRKADAELIRLHRDGKAIPAGMGGRLAHLIATQGEKFTRDMKGNIVRPKKKKKK